MDDIATFLNLDEIGKMISIPSSSSRDSKSFVSLPTSSTYETKNSPQDLADFLSACSLKPDHGTAVRDSLFENKYIEPERTYLVKCRPETPRYVDKTVYSPLARIALNYFNGKEGTHFKLVEVTAICVNYLYPKSLIHINFDCELVGFSGRKIFYAELKSPSAYDFKKEEVEILGCSLLEQVDLGNPMGISCGWCEIKLVHPGPLDGCRVVAGDRFENSEFWSYRSKVDPSWIQKKTTKGMEMYVIFAQKAIKHLNHVIHATRRSSPSQSQAYNQAGKELDPQKNAFEVAEWELVRVTTAMDKIKGVEKIIHLNFTAKRMGDESFCFAELTLPLFDNSSPHRWEIRMEPFLKVNGCCILKSDIENSLGRACDMCLDALAHPGARYGYETLCGDDFSGYDFKAVGF